MLLLKLHFLNAIFKIEIYLTLKEQQNLGFRTDMFKLHKQEGVISLGVLPVLIISVLD